MNTDNIISIDILKWTDSEWKACLKSISIKYEICDLDYYTWIEPLRILSIQDNTICIYVPTLHKNVLEYISLKYVSIIHDYIRELTSKKYNILFKGITDLQNEEIQNLASEYVSADHLDKILDDLMEKTGKYISADSHDNLELKQKLLRENPLIAHIKKYLEDILDVIIFDEDTNNISTHSENIYVAEAIFCHLLYQITD